MSVINNLIDKLCFYGTPKQFTLFKIATFSSFFEFLSLLIIFLSGIYDLKFNQEDIKDRIIKAGFANYKFTNFHINSYIIMAIIAFIFIILNILFFYVIFKFNTKIRSITNTSDSVNNTKKIKWNILLCTTYYLFLNIFSFLKIEESFEILDSKFYQFNENSSILSRLPILFIILINMPFAPESLILIDAGFLLLNYFTDVFSVIKIQIPFIAKQNEEHRNITIFNSSYFSENFSSQVKNICKLLKFDENFIRITNSISKDNAIIDTLNFNITTDSAPNTHTNTFPCYKILWRR